MILQNSFKYITNGGVWEEYPGSAGGLGQAGPDFAGLVNLTWNRG